MNTPSVPELLDLQMPVTFPGEHPIFRDHFPKSPLVPAFMQIARVREQVAALLQHAGERVEVHSIKFVRPLLPDCQAFLRLWLGSKPETFSFEIRLNDDVITHGEIRFG
jgi:3-hydroxymyristoyl/3-hydroxydecanoyl-(acyl carrier protein) dehydratase